MTRQILCDSFRQEQFVPVTQVREIYTVYIISREERDNKRGADCVVKNMLTGEERHLKLSALLGLSLKLPNGKKVRAFALGGSSTYVMLGTPPTSRQGVFIVPPGYQYIFGEDILSPGTCILSDGKNLHLLPWHLFRKLFIMQPNPIAAGRLRNQAAHSLPPLTSSQSSFDMASPNLPTTALPIPPSPKTTREKSSAIARITRQNKLIGLILQDGLRQKRVPLNQCIDLAERGEISNVKAVTRGGTTFLMGSGIALENLPSIEV